MGGVKMGRGGEGWFVFSFFLFFSVPTPSTGRPNTPIIRTNHLLPPIFFTRPRIRSRLWRPQNATRHADPPHVQRGADECLGGLCEGWYEGQGGC